MLVRSSVVAADAVGADVVVDALAVMEEEKDEAAEEVMVMEEAAVMAEDKGR